MNHQNGGDYRDCSEKEAETAAEEDEDQRDAAQTQAETANRGTETIRSNAETVLNNRMRIKSTPQTPVQASVLGPRSQQDPPSALTELPMLRKLIASPPLRQEWFQDVRNAMGAPIREIQQRVEMADRRRAFQRGQQSENYNHNSRFLRETRRRKRPNP